MMRLRRDSGFQKFQALTMQQFRAAWCLLMLAGIVTTWVLLHEWPAMTKDTLLSIAALLVAGNIGSLERAFRYRSIRLDTEIWTSVRLSEKYGMPVPPRSTYFGRACRRAAMDAIWSALLDATVCMGYLLFMPAGWFLLIAHCGLRLLEEAVQAIPEARADEETENSVALTIAMVHSLIAAAFGVFAWTACG